MTMRVLFGGKMISYSQWLQSLIEDLNYETLIEEPWRVRYLDADGTYRIMGNSRKRKKDGIWVSCLDEDLGEFPVIREKLEHAQNIVSVSIGMRQEIIPQKNV